MTRRLPSSSATLAALAAAHHPAADDQTLRLFAQELGVFSIHDVLSPRQSVRATRWLQQLASSTPREYILGHQDFAGLRLRVSPSVLIPRSDSEQMAGCAAHWLQILSAGGNTPHQLIVADIGTGSGALLAATLAMCGPLPVGWQAHAVDASKQALRVARQNLTIHAPQAQLHHGDLLQPLLPHIKDTPLVLLANLPYITTAEYAELDASVHREPAMALRAGADGLLLYRRMLGQFASTSSPGGAAVLEASPSTVRSLLQLVRATLPATQAYIYCDIGTTRERGVVVAWGSLSHLLENSNLYGIIA